MNTDKLKLLIIQRGITLKQALKRLDHAAFRVLFVVDEQGVLLGTLSDGDVRRAILAGKSLDSSIEDVFNKNPVSILTSKANKTVCREILYSKKILVLPVVDASKILVDFFTWEDVIEAGESKPILNYDKLDMSVVVMAGGKGTRLAPFTNVLPKPLIPIGEKTILEIIIEHFCDYGIKDYFLTVNYRGEMIKAYFDSIEKLYNVNYVWEKKFLGTAGCLTLLKGIVNKTFIVSNCDILVKANYHDVVSFHKSSRAAFTVVSSIQHISIPYGVVDFTDGGVVTGLQEKPEFSYPINTGVYILEPECLDLIPKDTVFHMTDLIESLIANGKKVCTYPVNEKDYIDIGQWDEYKKTLSLFPQELS